VQYSYKLIVGDPKSKNTYISVSYIAITLVYSSWIPDKRPLDKRPPDRKPLDGYLNTEPWNL